MRNGLPRGVLCLVVVLWFAFSTPLHAGARIVSLKPNITEILFALGVGDDVVGVSTWCDYPAAARRLPKVADYLQPNVEAVVQLHPDVVLTSTENSLRAPIDHVQRLGVHVEIFSFASIDETMTAITRIGEVVHARAAARRLVARLRDTVAQLQNSAPIPRPRALLLVARAPLVGAGPASLLGELLQLSGAENVLTARMPAYPRLSHERVLALRPDVTIDAEPIALFRPGPRLVDGLRVLRAQVMGQPIPTAAAPPKEDE